jgi:hypothetical protein
MKLTEGKVASGMFIEIMHVIEKYDGTLYVPTVLGVLEVAKMEVIKASLREDDDDETD